MSLYDTTYYDGSAWHQAADATLFRETAGDFVVGACVYLPTAVVGTIMAKYNSPTDVGWRLDNATSLGPRFYLYDTSLSQYQVVHGSAISGQFFWAVGYYDSAVQQIGLIVNGGTPTTLAFAGTPQHGTHPLCIAAIRSGAAIRNTARIGRAFFARPISNTTATAQAIAAKHYNAGRGVLYAEIEPSDRTSWGLVEWWDGNTASQGMKLIGQHNGYDLTANGSPTLADGPTQPSSSKPRILSPYLIGDVG